MLYFIVNPVAGKGKTVRIFEELKQKLDSSSIEYDFDYSEYAGHAIQLSENACKNGISSIIAVGGDGTVREVACGLLDKDAALGIIPTGSGNDLARALKLPQKPEEALETLIKGVTQNIDIGFANGLPFLNAAGLGFDVDVLLKMQKIKRRFSGSLAYILSVLAAIFFVKFKTVNIKINGMNVTRRILLMAVANGTHYGGGMNVAPYAKLNDGRMDVYVINALSRFKIPFILPKFVKGTYVTMDIVEYFQCDKVSVSCDTDTPLQLDGTLLSSTPTDFTLSPGRLKVFMPQA